MAEEIEKKEDETSQVDQPETNEEVSNPEASQEIDYKLELEKVKKQLGQAEHTIVSLKKEKKEEKSDDFEFLGEEEEDKKIEEKVNNAISSMKSELLGDIINEEISKLTSNEDERELIKYHYNNTIKQSGVNKQAIIDDIQSAYSVANKKKILKENSELKQALISKGTVLSGGSGANLDPLKAEEDYSKKLSPADLEFCKRRGIDPKTVKFDIK